MEEKINEIYDKLVEMFGQVKDKAGNLRFRRKNDKGKIGVFYSVANYIALLREDKVNVRDKEFKERLLSLNITLKDLSCAYKGYWRWWSCKGKCVNNTNDDNGKCVNNTNDDNDLEKIVFDYVQVNGLVNTVSTLETILDCLQTEKDQLLNRCRTIDVSLKELEEEKQSHMVELFGNKGA